MPMEVVSVAHPTNTIPDSFWTWKHFAHHNYIIWNSRYKFRLLFILEIFVYLLQIDGVKMDLFALFPHHNKLLFRIRSASFVLS